ncbi:hypothetical protein RJ640_021603 [Escallonia rubra]|uniref:Protein EARLY FLOWERING 4 domain-containing protein n=1 Tax=Escallonia rubra TaxID=112253 RepID=A0AA88RKZ8_9ASTE|nr:hypothetical protein RJ640_021603 [Escallonia rubra]
MASRKLEVSNHLASEAYRLYYGLLEAKDLGVERLLVLVDSWSLEKLVRKLPCRLSGQVWGTRIYGRSYRRRIFMISLKMTCVGLIIELNNNIRRAVDLYSDLSSYFTKALYSDLSSYFTKAMEGSSEG